MPGKAKKIIDLNNIKSLLFVRLGKLGDMMIASSIIKRIRKAYPHLKIGLITLPKSKELFRYNPDINVLKLWRPVLLPALMLERVRPWDLLVDLNDEPSRRSILALKLLGPKSSIAFHNKKTEGVFGKTVLIPSREKSHVLERLAVMAAALGVPMKKTCLLPAVYLKPGLMEKIIFTQRKITGKQKNMISLNISAGHKSRYWQPEKWEALAKALLKKYGKARIKILNSPADAAGAAALMKKINSPRVLRYDGKSLHDFLAHIAASDMLVSPDTSAVHAACALGVPVTGLYPEPYWNFVSWKPSGKNTKAIRSPKDGVDNIGFEEVKRVVLSMAGKL
jgi:ADP-heptose:LPS heptosyltransferase